MDGLIVGNQGFDCVVKAFRLGRSARRKNWPEGDFVCWDDKSKDIVRYKSKLNQTNSWFPDNLGQDIMANDWEVYAI